MYWYFTVTAIFTFKKVLR